MIRLRYFLVIAFMFGLSFNIQAQSNLYKLHSLFIYNFTKHIQWSEQAGAFTIGVYGSDNALNTLKSSLGSKKVWDQPIKFVKVNSAADVASCQLVYAPKSNKNEIVSLIEDSQKSDKLFVTEDDLIDLGANISFTLKGDRLNFKISKNKCEANGLKVSSSLLSLGTVVE